MMTKRITYATFEQPSAFLAISTQVDQVEQYNTLGNPRQPLMAFSGLFVIRVEPLNNL
jgi:hypothetical protein